MKLKCAIIYKLNTMPVITTFNWTILTCFNMCVIYTSVSSIMLVRSHFGLKRLAYFFKVINAIYWPSNTNTTISEYSTAYLLNQWISITKTEYIRIYIYTLEQKLSSIYCSGVKSYFPWPTSPLMDKYQLRTEIKHKQSMTCRLWRPRTYNCHWIYIYVPQQCTSLWKKC